MKIHTNTIATLAAAAAACVDSTAAIDSNDMSNIRYTPWKLLPNDLRVRAKNLLKYDEKTWNLPGSNLVEELSWSSLTEEQKEGAKWLGFSQGEWDCWQNHYSDYSWEDMVEEGVEEYWEDLGYNASTWDNDKWVPIEDDHWNEMDDEDKAALDALCYVEETWDGVIPITVNRMDSTLREVDSFPNTRYTPWKLLPNDLRVAAKDLLNYDEKTWNLPGSNPVEELSWSSLTEEQKEGAKMLGLPRWKWDCWQNHYGDYSWEDMVEEGVEEYWEDLGYNASTWDNDKWVPIEDDYWNEMDDDNDEGWDKAALDALCYVEETWGGVIPIFFNRMDSALGEVHAADADSCDNEEYDMYISFRKAHLYNIMSPAPSNDNPLCQDSVVLQDNGGIKDALNATNVALDEWTTEDTLHFGTSTWSAISSSFSQVEGYGNWSQYDLFKKNCALLSLNFYRNLGISTENNDTVIDFITNHLFSLPEARTFAEHSGSLPSSAPDFLFKKAIRTKVVEFISNYYAGQN